MTMPREGTALQGDREERRKLCARLLTQARADMLEKHPFVASLAFHLELVPTFGTIYGTAQNDGKKAYFEVDYFLSLTPEERMGLVAHEVWHCAMRHSQRLGDRDIQRFNYACDIETDLILTADGFFEEMLPYQEDWVGQSAEWIYERISDELACLDTKDFHEYQAPKAARSLPQPENQEGQGSGAPQEDDKDANEGKGEKEIKDGKDGEDGKKEKGDKQGDGDGSERNKGEGEADQNEQTNEAGSGLFEDADVDWEEILGDTATRMKQAGKLPGHFSKFVAPEERDTLSWKQLLASYVTMFVRGERDWLPPNRRFVSRGLYLPGRKRLPKLTLVLAIDTSGSTEEYLPAFVAELAALCKAFGEYEITVIQCDRCIKSVNTYDNDHPIDTSKIRINGLGGTSLCPPFLYIKQHPELQPQVFLYMTDGFGDAPAQRPPYPVLWCLTSEGEKPAEWGLEVRLKDE